MSEKKGSFIVFEGIDGSGKTTQINLLKQKIEALNIKCLETREPSDGPIGVMIRQCLTGDRKSTRLNSSHTLASRMPSSA